MFTDQPVEPAAVDTGARGSARRSVLEAAELAEELVDAWGSWAPTPSPDCTRIAFLSDRSGSPCVWVRPDGSNARRIAGSSSEHAELGPWTRSGHRVVVTIPAERADHKTVSYLADPATGELTALASGDLISVLDLSVDQEYVIIRDGQRGRQFCVVLDRRADQDYPLLPHPVTGSTERAIIRPSPAGEDEPLVAYVATDAGLPRRQLVAIPLGPHGWRGVSGVLSSREDAELEGLDADDAGRLLLLAWNVDGRSELEFLDTWTGESRAVPEVPGLVVSGALLRRDGS